MMHVNQYDGLTIAVSKAKYITPRSERTVLSDNAMSVLVPVLEKVLRWDSARIRRLFASYGLTLLEWEKRRTDWQIRKSALASPPPNPSKTGTPACYPTERRQDCGWIGAIAYPALLFLNPTCHRTASIGQSAQQRDATPEKEATMLLRALFLSSFIILSVFTAHAGSNHTGKNRSGPASRLRPQTRLQLRSLRRQRDYRKIPPGQTLTILDADGPPR